MPDAVSISQLPLWVQVSIVAFLGGTFAVALCLVSALLDLIPSLYRLVCSLFPEDGMRYEPEGEDA